MRSRFTGGSPAGVVVPVSGSGVSTGLSPDTAPLSVLRLPLAIIKSSATHMPSRAVQLARGWDGVAGLGDTFPYENSLSGLQRAVPFNSSRQPLAVRGG